MMKKILTLAMMFCAVLTLNAQILEGFHADPEVLYSQKTGKYYIYSTTDGFPGWGGYYFEVFSSDDLKDWKNEGTMLDVRSEQVPWATGNAWAPAIEEVKQADGSYKYYFYFSAHNPKTNRKEIGVAVANDPVGPFVSTEKPIITDADRPKDAKGGQAIDVDVFRDPKSGKYYLYWGNGFMAGAELNADMMTIKPETKVNLTPKGGTLQDYAYREGTYVIYRNGTYYFLWSVDDTGSPNYHVAYGTSKSPLGPIKVAAQPVILRQDSENNIYGTAHNSVLQIPGQDKWYFVYHRIHKDWINLRREGPGFHREVCIDEMNFDKSGNILPTIPTANEGKHIPAENPVVGDHYLYCHMSDRGEWTAYAISEDGLNYKDLLKGEPIFNTEEHARIEGGTRDAFVCRRHDGKGFLMVTTDMCVRKSKQWWNYGIDLYTSDDLIHWKSVTFDFRKGAEIFSDPEAPDTYKDYSTVRRVWAPQILWNPNYIWPNGKKGGYLIYYSLLNDVNGEDPYDRMYYSYADESFTTLTKPRLMFDWGYATIDADINYLESDGLYHMMIKKEGGKPGLFTATATRPEGPYSAPVDDDYIDFEGNKKCEGVSAFRIAGEKGWRIAYIEYSSKPKHYRICQADENMRNFRDPKDIVGVESPQHGSFLRITKEEYDRLQEWSDAQLANGDKDRFPNGDIIPDWFNDVTRVDVNALGKKYDITKYGVKRDSTLVQTEAIQRVIDLAAENGGGVIVVPKGTFLTGALFFKQGTHLKLDLGGRLKGCDRIEHFPLVQTRMEGQTLKYFAALINADGLKGFTITGPGTIDGNGWTYWKEFWIRRQFNRQCTNLEALRPRLVYLSNCEDVTVQDVRLINSPFWTNHLYRCHHVKYLGCYIYAPTSGLGVEGKNGAPSSDAIDIDVCHDVLVSGCYMNVNDDAVVIKGGKGTFADLDPNNGPTYNVIVQDCEYGKVHGCLTLGSESLHDWNIIIRRIKMSNATRVLWLKMRPDTPQHYEYVRVEDITGNCGSFLVTKPWTQFYVKEDRADMPVSQCNNIYIKNIDVKCKVFNDTEQSDKYILKDFFFENIKAEESDPKSGGKPTGVVTEFL